MQLEHDESGQALPEYSLLVGVMASIVLSLAVLFRAELAGMLSTIGAHFVDVVGRMA